MVREVDGDNQIALFIVLFVNFMNKVQKYEVGFI